LKTHLLKSTKLLSIFWKLKAENYCVISLIFKPLNYSDTL